jgi:class 3 adenylate cyclase
MEHLQTFSKHVPHILRQQLLLKLSKKFINETDSEWNQDSIRSPSLQRFHGALLFVDISGFTVLSQKLDIESLKNHINDYFTKMLAIVDKWGGDVVKFAGDALYIIWHSHLSESNEFSIHESSREENIDPSVLEGVDPQSFESVERAVACGLEICSVCGHYEIKLTDNGSDTHIHMFDRFLPQRRMSIASGKVLPTDPGNKSEEVTHLDVHAGISMGMMAGIDIGAEDRWEYFLAGTPLNDVALAESQAHKGDVVVSEKLHKIIHGNTISHRYTDTSKLLPCGCTLISEGFCRVKKVNIQPPAIVKKNRNKARKEGIQQIANENSKITDDVAHDIDLLFIALNPYFRKLYNSMSPLNTEMSPKAVANEADTMTPTKGRQRKIRDRKGDQVATFINYEMHQNFSNTITKVLCDDLARHVHDAVRNDYLFTNVEEYDNCRDLVAAFITRTNIGGSHLVRYQSPSAQLVRSNAINDPDELDALHEGTLKLKPEPFADQLAVTSEVLTNNAEVRSVTVMFIKVDVIDLKIFVEENTAKLSSVEDMPNVDNVFSFLERTEKESEQDTKLLTLVQDCYGILYKAIYGNGGQMRQFIVDDKGTVCIATFGLRGAVTVDNAASSIEAANQIINGLPTIGLSASIGVTTGKAYCGLVGSPMRHEYAVMGPSTNLSARLMCKAAPNSVICDEDTMKRDRTHEYQPLTEITAKGYSLPVKIFQPMLPGTATNDMGGRNAPAPAPLMTTKLKSTTQFTLKVAARQAVKTRTETRFSSIYTYMIRHMRLDWILSNKRKWELEIRDMMNSPFFYENEYTKAQRKSVSDITLSQTISISEISSTSFHVASTPIRKLHGRKKEVRKFLSALLPPLQSTGNCMFNLDAPTQMVVISGGMGSGKKTILSAIARKIQFMAERDKSLNLFIARKKGPISRSKSMFGFWKKLTISLITQFNQDTTAITLPPTQRIVPSASRNVNLKRMLLGLDRMLKIFSREQANLRDLFIRFLTDDEEDEVTTNDFKSSQLENIADGFATFMNFMPILANRAIIVFIEDVHLLDVWSLRVMNLVWKKAKGLNMLVTYDGDQTTEETLNIMPDNAQLYRLVNTQSRLSTNSRDNFFRSYGDQKRFLLVELPPLDKESTIKVAKEALADVGIAAADSDLAKLYDISGGNPLYTIELTKALQTIHHQSGNDGVNDIKADLNELFNMNSRVEEVICYRFDKLTSAQQLVLKAAAVAVSNGRNFTGELIVYMLEENDQFSVNSEQTAAKKTIEETIQTELDGKSQNEAVDRILLHLVHHHDFIRLASATERKGHSTQRQYMFTIPLEQTSIYKLIIDEQKQYFHERVAQFCRKSSIHHRATDNIDDRIEEWKEEAYHWEYATSWGNALKALMFCAMRERERGNEVSWLQYLQQAYGLYKQLEQEIGVIVPLNEDRLPDSKILAKILLHDPQSYDEETVNSMRNLDKDMQMIFDILGEIEHDVGPLIIFMHLSLADAYIISWEDIRLLIQTLGIALKLILAAKLIQLYPARSKSMKPTRAQNTLTNTTTSTPTSASLLFIAKHDDQPSSKVIAKQGKSANAHNSTSIRPSSYLFHLVSTIYLTTSLCISVVSDLEKLAFSRLKMLHIPHAINELALKLDLRDEIQNESLEALYLINQNRFEEVADFWRRSNVMRTNFLLEPARRRVLQFGMDASVFVTGRIIQWLRLSGREIIFREEYTQKSLQNIFLIPHLPSIEHFFIQSFAPCIFMNDYDTALNTRSSYRNAAAAQKEQIEVTPYSLRTVFTLWLKCFFVLSHPVDHIEVWESDRFYLDEVCQTIQISASLLEACNLGDNHTITTVTMKYLIASGACLCSITSQIICGYLFLLAVEEESIRPVDEIMKLWLQRTLKVMEISTNYHTNNNGEILPGDILDHFARSGSGNWSILNIINPLCMMLKLLDHRRDLSLHLLLPQSLSIVSFFFDHHIQRLSEQCDKLELLAAKDALHNVREGFQPYLQDRRR